MAVEEFFKHRGWSGTQHLYKDAEDYGKMMYNQALDDYHELQKITYIQGQTGYLTKELVESKLKKL